MTCLHYLVPLLILFEQPVDQGHGQLVIPTVNIVPSCRACPEVDEILQQIRSNISDILNEFDIQVVSECGDGLWYRVAYLNMTYPSQRCPGAWREYNTSGVRACGRPVSTAGSCPATSYSTNQQYSMVCGKVIGYQVGTPDGFYQFNRHVSIDQGYLDGVSITYGEPDHHHIWSYAAGHSENGLTRRSIGNCPCRSSLQGAAPPLLIVDNDYYCESGNPINQSSLLKVYSSDPLWDGQQCEGTCCSDTKTPPWFSVQLPTHTTDRIEVRICGDEGTSNEDVIIEQLEIYVQ